MYIWNLLTNGGSKPCREGLMNVAAFIIALLGALMLHEIAHGLVALWNGDNTAKSMGRLTLNPAKHFSFIGMLMFLFVGFGWANPVPVNPNNFRNRKAGMIEVSLAGVVTNLVLAFIFGSLYVFMAATTIGIGLKSSSPYLWQFLAYLGYLSMQLNISFALFNLLPLYPLDGYRFVSCFVPQENGVMTFLRRYSLYIILALVLLNNVLPQYSPLYWYVGWVGDKIFEAFASFWLMLLV